MSHVCCCSFWNSGVSAFLPFLWVKCYTVEFSHQFLTLGQPCGQCLSSKSVVQFPTPAVFLLVGPRARYLTPCGSTAEPSLCGCNVKDCLFYWADWTLDIVSALCMNLCECDKCYINSIQLLETKQLLGWWINPIGWFLNNENNCSQQY